MTTSEKLRQVRQVALDHFIWTPWLSERVRADFLDGKCQLREYQNIPIVDYSRPWGSERNASSQ